MKRIKAMSTIMTTAITAAQPAFAAAGAAEDNSDYVVWAFLGFCALIVIGQLLPMVRNLRAQKPVAHQKEVKEKA